MRFVRSHWLVSLGAALTLSLPAIALGQSGAAQLTTIAPGVGGPYEPLGQENGLENGSPGTEQSHCAWQSVGEKTQVSIVWMSGDVSDADRPWQCKMSVLQLEPDKAPTLLLDQLQITANGNPNNDNENPCNSPYITSMQDVGYPDLFLLAYAENTTNGNTRSVAQVITREGEFIGNRLTYSNNNNNNIGKPSGTQYMARGAEIGVGDNEVVVMLGNYDNNAARTYVRRVNIDMTDMASPQLSNGFIRTVVSPSPIARYSMLQDGADRVLACGAEGNARPSDNIECTLVDVLTGDTLFTQDIKTGQQGAQFNQPEIFSMGPGKIGAVTVMTSADGKNTNNAGENSNTMGFYDLTDQGLTMITEVSSVGPYPRHGAGDVAWFGVDGSEQLRAYTVQAPITGAGQPALQYVAFDPILRQATVDAQREQWPVGYYGDSGMLANIYGSNPNSEGRDFLQTCKDIPNPGYQVQDGWMAHVKTFVGVPHSGRITEDFENQPKNALFFSLVPGITSVEVTPEPPTAPTDPEPGEPPPVEPPPVEPPPEDGGTPTTPVLPGEPGACACTVVGSDNNSAPLALIALGLGLALALRRRREEV